MAARLPYLSGVLEEKFAALRESYRHGLPEQLEALRAKVAAVSESRGHAALADAKGLAHRLKGTAGSYGFDGVAAEIEGIEEILERAESGEARLGAADRGAIEAALARAHASLG